MGSVLGCAVWFSRTLVVPCGSRMPLRQAKLGFRPPNPPFQPTASRPRSLAFWQLLWCACGS
jgi:hypothetical protein